MIEFVLRPSMRPGPPVAMTTAPAANARGFMLRRSSATRPTQRPPSSRAGPTNSQPSHFVTRPPRPPRPPPPRSPPPFPLELPALVLRHQAARLVAPHLLVERVEQLLPGGRAGERGAAVHRAAAAAEVEQALGRAIERHAHAVEQIDDAGRRVAHPLDGGLVREEVAAAARVEEVHLGRIVLALHIHGAVDAALRAHRVRALDRHDREQVHRHAGLGQLDRRHEAGEPAPDHGDARGGHQRDPRSRTTEPCSAACGFWRKLARKPRKPRSDPTPSTDRARVTASPSRATWRCAPRPVTRPQWIANPNRPFPKWEHAANAPRTQNASNARV